VKIALILFDGVTFLDFVGFYDVVTRLRLFDKTKDSTWNICGIQSEVTDELGMKVAINKVKPNLSEYDMVFIPGGMGTRALRFNEEFISWLKQAEQVQYKISVCTGALLFGSAGFLRDKNATTHPRAYDLLEPYCKKVIKSRIVHDGSIITAGGVATSIDLGLYVVGLLLGQEEVEVVKQQMDYPYVCPEVVII
jgi:transcriptional regulator GlxA family with amidase domain